LHKTYSMRNWRISILALGIAGLITAFFYFSVMMTTSESGVFGGGSVSLPEGDTAFGGLFYEPRFNDTLPYYIYRELERIAKNVKAERDLENRSVAVSGVSISLWGLYSIEEPGDRSWKENLMRQLFFQLDNVEKKASLKIAATTNKDSIEKIYKLLGDSILYYRDSYNKQFDAVHRNREKYYYVALDGYKIDVESKFFIQNGTYNLAYVKNDVIKKKKEGTWKFGHYERKKVPVRYAAEHERVLIPVNKQLYDGMYVLIHVLLWGVLFVGLYFFLGLPVRILVSISKGKAFDDINVRRFNTIACAILVLGLFKLIFPYLLDFLLRNKVPDDFMLPSFITELWNFGGWFLLALAVFITGKAFQKGNRLQKEQDLTI
jgi:hypothetical protein